MKHAGRFILIAAVAATAMAAGVRAEGDKNHERHQKRWAGEKETVEAEQARDRLHARDRDRDRDGSCTVDARQKRSNNGRGEGDRLRDGSCQD